MKNKTSSLKIGVGTPTILMIFVVLCMVILAVLSYQEAQTQSRLVSKEKSYIQSYYEALTKSEFIQDELQMLVAQNKTDAFIQEYVLTAYDVNLKNDETNFVYDTIIDDSKQLHIELLKHNPQTALVWKVENRRGTND